MATTTKRIDSETIQALRATIEQIDCLSQGGFSEICAIAKLALYAMETTDGCKDLETIASALRAILGKAIDIENCINAEAEEVGCNYKDKQAERRNAAYRAAEEFDRARDGSRFGAV